MIDGFIGGILTTLAIEFLMILIITFGGSEK